jgi:lipopolysaccharide/colanic/teichoic acid biosynthesis glycosyltransferase
MSSSRPLRVEPVETSIQPPGTHGATDGGAHRRVRPHRPTGAGPAARAPRATHAHAHAHAHREGDLLVLPWALPTDAPFALQPLPRWGLTVKRLLDVVGALVALVVFAPALVVLAILIKLDSPGPVFFTQARLGIGGREFRCLKLRTMCAGAEALLDGDPALRAEYLANGFKLPTHADRRVTTLGRVLRTTSLDELPQFWNVLRGEMSLVGPRPIVPDELAHYGPNHAVLCSVRPGVTGAWAVGGRSRIGYPERATIELDYVRGWSLRRDFRILLRTVGVVVQRHGAH